MYTKKKSGGASYSAAQKIHPQTQSMTSHRIEKLQEIFRNEVAQILQRKFSSPGTLLTVNKVDIARKGEHATVYVSIFPVSQEDRGERMLRAITFAMQQMLNKKLQIHPVPQLRFVVDRSVQELAHIDTLIRDVQNVASSQPMHAKSSRRKFRKTA